MDGALLSDGTHDADLHYSTRLDCQSNVYFCVQYTIHDHDNRSVPPQISPSPSVLISPDDPPLHALTVSEIRPDSFLLSLS